MALVAMEPPMDDRRKEILGLVLAIAMLPPVAALDVYAEAHAPHAAPTPPAHERFDADDAPPANATASPTPSTPTTPSVAA